MSLFQILLIKIFIDFLIIIIFKLLLCQHLIKFINSFWLSKIKTYFIIIIIIKLRNNLYFITLIIKESSLEMQVYE